MRTKLVKITLAAGFCACLISLSACSVGYVSKVTVEPEYIQGAAVIHYPMIAKMKIGSEKISHVYKFNWKCKIIKECEKMAYNDALNKLYVGESNIDGILNPRYEHYNITGEYLTTITVIGYPYIYTEFREMTKEDKELLASTANANSKASAQTTSTADTKTPAKNNPIDTNIRVPVQIDKQLHIINEK